MFAQPVAARAAAGFLYPLEPSRKDSAPSFVRPAQLHYPGYATIGSDSFRAAAFRGRPLDPALLAAFTGGRFGITQRTRVPPSGAGSTPLILGGALAFYLSDLSVARDRFIREAFVNRLWGLPLYYGAQLLLAATVRA